MLVSSAQVLSTLQLMGIYNSNNVINFMQSNREKTKDSAQ